MEGIGGRRRYNNLDDICDVFMAKFIDAVVTMRQSIVECLYNKQSSGLAHIPRSDKIILMIVL